MAGGKPMGTVSRFTFITHSPQHDSEKVGRESGISTPVVQQAIAMTQKQEMVISKVGSPKPDRVGGTR